MQQFISGYIDYPDIPHAYVMHHITGFGDQGGEPVKVLEIVGSDDDYDRLVEKGKELFPRDPSGWTYDNYRINVNTATEQGKALYDEYSERVGAEFKHIEDYPELYRKYEIGGYSFYFKKTDELDW